MTIAEPKNELVCPIATCGSTAIAYGNEDCDDQDSSTNALATVPLLRACDPIENDRFPPNSG